ncbi:MAG TPA: hypothetical protein VGC51_09560 [Hansschlegelia sp.]
MSASVNGRAEPGEGDLLAPWRATDRLDAKDAALFERLMAEDSEIARRLAVACEARDAAIALHESLPTPSAAAREKLLARIDAHEAQRSTGSAWGAVRRFGERLAALSPNALAWGAAAAALLIAVEGGLLTKAYLGSGEARYETASDGRDAVGGGQHVLVAFTPTATAEAIASLLSETKAEIVAGPKPGGVFVLRIADRAMGKPELETAVERLKARSGVVRFVVAQ